MSKEDLFFYIRYAGHDLGEIIYSSHPPLENFILCDGQASGDLFQNDDYKEFVDFLIRNRRSNNYTQKEASGFFRKNNIKSVALTPSELVPIPSSGNDMELNPSYYSRFKIEPIDFITKNGLSFGQGNVVKYVCRYKYKYENSKAGRIMDLKKAISNIQKLIKAEEELE